MTELSGTLEGVGLTAIVRFLIGLKKSGCLQLHQEDWYGQIFFTEGQVSGATLGSRTGLSALDALVETLPAATFVFDSQVRLPSEPTIRLNQDTLQAHLDELAARVEKGMRKLPSADAVPVVVMQDEDAEEPVPLDRAMLQTLLLVDGQRSVRQIVAQRGSFEPLWHLASLAEVGVISLEPEPVVMQQPTPEPPAAVQQPTPEAAAVQQPTPEAAVMQQPTPVPVVMQQPTPAPVFMQPAPAPPVLEPTPVQQVVGPKPAPAIVESRPAQAVVQPSPSPAAVEPMLGSGAVDPWPAPAFVETAHGAPLVDEDEPATSARCPRLGFNDDPNSSFSRPTRLHRCFAAGAPLPLSLDQQRELCLSDHFGTCPRLQQVDTGASASPKNVGGRWNGAARITPGAAPAPDAEDPRIVRLPFAGRGPAASRGSVASSVAESPVARSSHAAAADSVAARPTPLRARLDRVVVSAPSEAPEADPSPRPSHHAAPEASTQTRQPSYSSSETVTAYKRPASVQAPREPQRPRPIAESPATEAAPPRGTDDMTPSAAPAVRRIFNIPVGVIAGGAAILIVIAVVGYLLAPQAGTLFDDNSIDPSALPNTSRLAQGTPVTALNLARPTPAPADAQPASAAAQPAAAGPNAAQAPSSASGKPAASTAVKAQITNAQPTLGLPTTLLDERFQSNDANWPSNPQGVASIINGAYRIATREAGQFVAIGAPIQSVPSDVVVTADFRKLAGPAGGGYGIIVRDQAASQHDGTSQDGRYYVLEAGDRGEVGIWRRDNDHWVDLLPWQHSDAVQAGNATNELTVRATGNTLTLAVNGTQVATKTDNSLSGGGVGVFVGGDGNQVALDHFTIQTP